MNDKAYRIYYFISGMKQFCSKAIPDRNGVISRISEIGERRVIGIKFQGVELSGDEKTAIYLEARNRKKSN